MKKRIITLLLATFSLSQTAQAVEAGSIPASVLCSLSAIEILADGSRGEPIETKKNINVRQHSEDQESPNVIDLKIGDRDWEIQTNSDVTYSGSILDPNFINGMAHLGTRLTVTDKRNRRTLVELGDADNQMPQSVNVGGKEGKELYLTNSLAGQFYTPNGRQIHFSARCFFAEVSF